jgi:hypothetical protein
VRIAFVCAGDVRRELHAIAAGWRRRGFAALSNFRGERSAVRRQQRSAAIESADNASIVIEGVETMSDKDRAKKDHERTDKKNKRMREHENQQAVGAAPREQARDQSNLNEVRGNAKQES